jgi:transposase
MFRFDADLRIYLHREPIDFRAGLNTLVTMVEQSMQLDPLARAVFAFHNRKRDRVKLLLYDRAGFWLLMKRLEADRFVWPRRQQAVIELRQSSFTCCSTVSMSTQYVATQRGSTATRAETGNRRRCR